MTHLIKTAVAIAAVSLATSACSGESEPLTKAATDNVTPAQTPAEPLETETPEPTPEPEPEPEPVTQDVIYDLEATWEENGVILTLTNFRVLDAATHDEYWKFEEDSLTFIVMDGVVENNTDMPIDFYPDQAVLIVGDAQLDASMEGVGDLGGTIFEGVRTEGEIVWEIDETVEWVTSYDEFQYKVIGGAINTDDWSEAITGDIDLTLRPRR
jgi:hypothetical protein